jgi:glyoxylase-like metal-dependent hydrolase (beta-lactamase superfamily II)
MSAAPVELSPRVTRLRAPNPGPMTLDGTNGYAIDGGGGRWIAVDPGPDIDAHIEAFARTAAEAGAAYEAIVVTHGHPDHYPAAAPLARLTGAPVYAHALVPFAHDRTLSDGDRLTVGEATLRVIEAPGHARDHLVFYLEDERALFTGDVILGRGTVVVAPPGGDMRAYQATLRRLRDELPDAAAIYGGHGPEIRKPAETIAFYIAHREERERAILAQLEDGTKTIPALVTMIYRDVEERLWPAAARQLLAYLIALEREGRVVSVAVDREPDERERALLYPSSGPFGDERTRAVARAELGIGSAMPFLRYGLTSSRPPSS